MKWQKMVKRIVDWTKAVLVPNFFKGEQINLLQTCQVNFDTFKDSVLDEIIEQSISHHIGEQEALSSHSLGFAKSKLYQNQSNFLLWEIGSLYRHLGSKDVIYLNFRKFWCSHTLHFSTNSKDVIQSRPY